MIRTICVATLSCVLLMTQAPLSRAAEPGTQPAAEPTAGDEAFSLISKLVGGEWRIEANWKVDNNPLHARAIYHWGPGKKFVRAETYPQTSEGKEYLRYETIYGVRDGKLTVWGFTYDGSMDQTTMQVKGNTLSIDKDLKGSNGKSKLRQTVTLLDDNRLAWKVWTESESKTTELMDGTWVRTASASK